MIYRLPLQTVDYVTSPITCCCSGEQLAETEVAGREREGIRVRARRRGERARAAQEERRAPRGKGGLGGWAAKSYLAPSQSYHHILLLHKVIIVSSSFTKLSSYLVVVEIPSQSHILFS